MKCRRNKQELAAAGYQFNNDGEHRPFYCKPGGRYDHGRFEIWIDGGQIRVLEFLGNTRKVFLWMMQNIDTITWDDWGNLSPDQTIRLLINEATGEVVPVNLDSFDTHSAMRAAYPARDWIFIDFATKEDCQQLIREILYLRNS